MSLFRHGVASGDPDSDSVVIWTRVSGSDGARTELRWTIARDPALTDVVASGEVEAAAAADSDYTAQADVDGLQPDTHYWYAFEAAGERSPVGRTHTLPGRDVGHLRFAVVSCTKFNARFFNGCAAHR